ncbi:hypothetical protein AV530_004909 [Patagioenas fasciata monilis]|uniref:Uncharacterized protein n=1 Tax=Patagioenas fasciata monilis TaxID=372326 RepID=A0A1V4K381_PATFA|nr:hypothetical protein AV530_004909 [Patagioenas fasciata monilis]
MMVFVFPNGSYSLPLSWDPALSSCCAQGSWESVVTVLKDLCCLPGSTPPTPQCPALGKMETGNQNLASTEPKTHQGIHYMISEEPLQAVEWDLAERSTVHLHEGGKGLGLKQ